jgi:hypothetical protein
LRSSLRVLAEPTFSACCLSRAAIDLRAEPAGSVAERVFCSTRASEREGQKDDRKIWQSLSSTYARWQHFDEQSEHRKTLRIKLEVASVTGRLAGVRYRATHVQRHGGMMQREPWRRLSILQCRVEPIRLLAEELLQRVNRRLPLD